MSILLTGYTGNLGLAMAQALRSRPVWALVRNPQEAPLTEGVTVVQGSLEDFPPGLESEIDVIVHGAASTSFKAPLSILRQINVEGSGRLLEFARRCSRLRRFVHLSTVCVCGDRSGAVPEAVLSRPANFINAYEQSKWEAEGMALASGLPVEVIRLSIVAGSELDGSVRRLGALHHTLHWLYRGLIPMMPGEPASRVDLISTEFAARFVAEVLRGPEASGQIWHAAAGETAPTVADLFGWLGELFAQRSRGWARGSVVMPDLVDGQTFQMFEASVRQSGDLLFQRVCDDAQSFLPGLLQPRLLETSLAREIPKADWRELTAKVLGWSLATNWGRQ